MKKITLITLLFIAITGFSQNSEKAVNLLNEVSKNVASYKTISLSFDYLLDNEKESIHQRTTGSVNLEGEHYHLNFMGIERIKRIYV